MISVTELRKGTVFAEDGKPYSVVDYRHIKVGRGAANIKVKVKDLKSGSTLEKTFMSGASVEEATVDRKKAQYLYSDDKNLNFMDPHTFEQFSVSKAIGENASKFLKEGAETVLFVFGNEPISIELPLKVDLKVTEAPPGEKGDTKQGGTKQAMLETGYSLQVPLFIKTGDILRISTETGDYVERAS